METPYQQLADDSFCYETDEAIPENHEIYKSEISLRNIIRIQRWFRENQYGIKVKYIMWNKRKELTVLDKCLSQLREINCSTDTLYREVGGTTVSTVNNTISKGLKSYQDIISNNQFSSSLRSILSSFDTLISLNPQSFSLLGQRYTLPPTLHYFKSNYRSIVSAILIHYCPKETLLVDEEEYDNSLEANSCLLSASLFIFSLQKLVIDYGKLIMDDTSSNSDNTVITRSNNMKILKRYSSFEFTLGHFIDDFHKWKVRNLILLCVFVNVLCAIILVILNHVCRAIIFILANKILILIFSSNFTLTMKNCFYS